MEENTVWWWEEGCWLSRKQHRRWGILTGLGRGLLGNPPNAWKSAVLLATRLNLWSWASSFSLSFWGKGLVNSLTELSLVYTDCTCLVSNLIFNTHTSPWSLAPCFGVFRVILFSASLCLIPMWLFSLISSSRTLTKWNYSRYTTVWLFTKLHDFEICWGCCLWQLWVIFV